MGTWVLINARWYQVKELQTSRDNMATEIGQLNAAIAALLDQRQEPETAPRIDEAMARLADGKTEAAEQILNEVLTRAKAEGTRALKQAASAARHLGALRYLHDTQAAVEAYTEAVNLDPDDPAGWNMLGLLHLRQGQLDPAATAFERVLGLGNQIEDKAVIATALSHLGVIYQIRGDLDKAEETHLMALAIDEEIDRKEGMANDYGNLGLIYRTRGELEKAEKFLRRSLALNDKVGRKEGMANTYGNLGVIYQTRGELEKAEEMHLLALAIDEGFDRKEGKANAYGNLGLIYRTRGDLDKAEEFFRKSLALDEKLGDKEGIALQYGNLGLICQTRGDVAGACEHWSTALRLFEEVGAVPQIEQTRDLMKDAGCTTRGDEEGEA